MLTGAIIKQHNEKKSSPAIYTPASVLLLTSACHSTDTVQRWRSCWCELHGSLCWNCTPQQTFIIFLALCARPLKWHTRCFPLERKVRFYISELSTYWLLERALWVTWAAAGRGLLEQACADMCSVGIWNYRRRHTVGTLSGGSCRTASVTCAWMT